jgi:hypothetical protein
MREGDKVRVGEKVYEVFTLFENVVMVKDLKV